MSTQQSKVCNCGYFLANAANTAGKISRAVKISFFILSASLKPGLQSRILQERLFFSCIFFPAGRNAKAKFSAYSVYAEAYGRSRFLYPYPFSAAKYEIIEAVGA
jgi:hypothetical protein